MRDSMRKYYETMQGIYDAIISDPANEEAFKLAGKAIAEKLNKDELVYLVGPGGHSNMSTEETLCRAGMPVQLAPMIDVTNLMFGTTKTRFLQRSSKYAEGVLDQYYLKKGDVLVVINAYGINTLCIDLAVKARERGVTVIGISSSLHADKIPKDHPARHPTAMNLQDAVDIFIDCKMPFGDATTEVSGADQYMGPTSTLCNVFCVDMMMISAVEELVEIGGKPEIWRSINVPGGDEYNAAYFRNYGNRIKYLL